MEIKLITQSEIIQEYKKIVNDLQIIKGVVAYWTWDEKFIKNNFGKKLLTVLKNKESFFCLDISSPASDIDNIANCVNVAKNIYVFSYRLKVSKSDERSISILHSKITYFKTSKNQFVILGSHNNTVSAFGGKNMEHSILMKFPLRPRMQDKKILNDILLELERIKTMCLKFDINLTDFYKNLQVFREMNTPRIVMQIDSDQLNNLSENQTVSIISFNKLATDSPDNLENIKDNIVFIHFYNNNNYKVFRAIGEADDEVEAGSMDEKVTDSDYIAIRISGLSDPLGLPYNTYQSIRNQQIKGSSINFTDHFIQRVRLINEVTNIDSLREFTKIPRKINLFIPITIEDLKQLGFEEYDLKNIIKIDPKKHNIAFVNSERVRLLKNSKPYIKKIDINTDNETRLKLNVCLQEIFSIITHQNDSETHGKNKMKLTILNKLANCFSKNEYEEDNTIKNLQKIINEGIKEKKLSTKSNILNQYGGKYRMISDETLNTIK